MVRRKVVFNIDENTSSSSLRVSVMNNTPIITIRTHVLLVSNYHFDYKSTLGIAKTTVFNHLHPAGNNMNIAFTNVLKQNTFSVSSCLDKTKKTKIKQKIQNIWVQTRAYSIQTPFLKELKLRKSYLGRGLGGGV